ncbi:MULTISPECIES: fructose-specific PTS transporter subunit EIIC [Brevibacterium]|uniref:PTS system D-fructose-specific transporter subunit IIABC n=1 Tax=Brevibacterium casei S18 TaxID=1229781 RepID=K9AGD8_9MICO|nr:fructose-specific PTS transporter subunit EIIC [Brevibacterium casei]EKU45186.1 PTS system D-fructose-specific transporter subunit IIABC [Brevibacterium casei S18]MCT1764515.1 fructose-specific PTS transporter subunit EIIC [Brevibacterium casei]NJE67403.1 PTS lactose transporter subunit IIC [Brevibacterium sp. LS14]QZE25385.1 fructose-specific PTS transporter subunit EIIC [Brevibacterium casei]
MPLINDEQVLLDLGDADRSAATRRLAECLVATGRCTDLDLFVADVEEREAKTATGLPGGIAIPHARSAAITEPSLVFGRTTDGIPWGAKDGPARLVFLIAAPADGGDAHMKVLPQLARALMKEDFRQALLNAATPAEVVAIVEEQVHLDDDASATAATSPTAPASAGPSTAAGSPTTDGADTPAEAAAPVPASSPSTEPSPTDPPSTEPPSAEARSAESADRTFRFVGVTSCPTGIAHTYMAAESLENAARAAGHEIIVETQGSAGSTPLTAAQIAAADAVIFAHDVEVKERARFAGKPTLDVGVKKAISEGPQLISRAAELAAAGPTEATASAIIDERTEDEATERLGFGTKLRQWLMTGVSYMIPFVAAGGILIAVSFMLAQIALGESGAIEIVKYGLVGDDQYNIAQNFDLTSLTSWAALAYVIGAASFGFLVPILSGYIAFAIADRPGLVPGIVAGSVAVTMNAGFLGGIVTGLLAGFVAKWISSWKVHKGVRGVMPVVVIPLLSTLVTAGLFITVLGRPIVALMDGLNAGLGSLTGGGVLILGLILGAMMGFDLGGPVNKVAYGFATAGLSAAGTAMDAPQLKIMAAVMAAGMVAPLALALATTVAPKLFSVPERENGKAAWLLGASFISEGAIPFAAADPIRIIIASTIGSSATGALVMFFGSTLLAPHGGIWVLPLIGQPLLFVLALAVGVAITAALVVLLKALAARRRAEKAADSLPEAAPVAA